MTKKNEKNTKATKNEIAGLLHKGEEIGARGEAAKKAKLWKPGEQYTKTVAGKDGKDHTIRLDCRADGFYVGGKRYETPSSAVNDFTANVLGWKGRRSPADFFGKWNAPKTDKPAAKKPAKKAEKKIKKPAKNPTKKPAAKPIKKSKKPAAKAAQVPESIGADGSIAS